MRKDVGNPSPDKGFASHPSAGELGYQGRWRISREGGGAER